MSVARALVRLAQYNPPGAQNKGRERDTQVARGEPAKNKYRCRAPLFLKAALHICKALLRLFLGSICFCCSPGFRGVRFV